MRDAVTTRRLIPLFALLATIACQSAPTAPPAPLRVFSSNGVRALLDDARADLERAAGRPIAFDFTTAAALRRRIDGGDVPDVAVLTTPLIAELTTQGRLAAGSARDLARVGVGAAVRAGAPTPPIDTPEAFKALLLGAGSIAFTAEGQSRAAIDAAFARLGIVAAMQPKTQLLGPGEAPGAVARGDAEVVLTLVSELIGVPGLHVLGPLPAALQTYVTFTAARGANAADPAAVDRLIAAMAESANAARLARLGLESPTAAAARP
jgi:molybdate transport system substrate-binding protein